MNRLMHRVRTLTILVAVLVSGRSLTGQEKPKPWFDRRTDWNGYSRLHFRIADRPAWVVAPKKPAPGKPWIWRARFPGYHAEMDLALVEKGFHVVHVDVAGMFGSPEAVAIGDQLYEYLTRKHGFASKVTMEGVSRGGLLVYNWAAKNPNKVACIYCDTPVLDFKSWPGGRGEGLGSKGAWQQCLKAWNLTEAQALKHQHNPVDHVRILAKAKIPILHVVSDNDRVVPPKENTYVLRDRLKKLEHDLEVIVVPKGTAKSNGHHFPHPDPQRVIAFIAKHGKAGTGD